MARRISRSMSIEMRIVLGALCVFNGIMLAVLGIVSLLYVDGRSGIVGAAGFWIAALALFWLSRRLRQDDPM